MKNYFKQNSRIIWTAIFAVLWLGSNLLAIFFTARWTFDHLIGLLLGNLIFGLMTAYLVGLFKLAKRLVVWETKKVERFYRWSFWILAIVLFIFPFFFMIHVPGSAHEWDFFVIFDSTTQLHGESFTHLPMTVSRLGYFLRYPNNQFFGILFNHFFAPFADSFTLKIWVMTAVSAFLTALAGVSASLLVKRLSGKRVSALFNAIALGFIPFYFYGAQLYSDTLTLPFVVLGLLFIVYAFQAPNLKKQLSYYFIASLFLVIGYEFKPTVAIVAIAALIFFAINKKWKQLFIFLALFVVVFASGHELVKTTVASEPAFSQQANERYNLPLMHWIAMSWSPTNKTGGFNKKIRIYSSSFSSYKAKNKADRTLFVLEVKKMGPLGIFRQIGRKLGYTWAFSDLNSSFYTYYHENPIIHRYFDYLDMGKKQGNITGWLMLKAAQTMYWIPLVILMWREIFYQLRKKNWQSPWFIAALSVVGLTMFLILWEANSRYLYNFIPIMIALATLGLARFLKRRPPTV